MEISKNFLIFVFLFSSRIFAADVYLSPSGDNSNDGAVPSRPVATLPYAVQLAQNYFKQDEHEVRILVQTGTYLAQNTIVNIDKGIGKLSIIGVSNDPSSFPVFDGAGDASTWFTLKSSKASPYTHLVG